MGLETEDIWGSILIFTPHCENVFKCLLNLQWSEDKEAQVIEGSTLVVLVW